MKGEKCSLKDCDNIITCQGKVCEHHRYLKYYYKSYYPKIIKISRIEFFYFNCESINKNGCILWKGRKEKIGYGVLWDGKKAIKAHRFAYELHHGKIPAHLKCLHKCDVRSCVASEHLYLGTQLDNMRDCARKGRIYSSKTRNRKKQKDKK